MPRKATDLRDATVLSLIRARTLALDNVEADRVDPVMEGDGPRIVVTTGLAMEGLSAGGTAPKFRCTLSLDITAIAFAAHRDDIRTLIDRLEEQILEALLTDPDWTRLAQNPDQISVNRSYAPGHLIQAELMIHIKLGWKETYPPRLSIPLAGVDLTINPPGATAATPPIRVRAATLDPNPGATL